jgi:hypothetical protein
MELSPLARQRLERIGKLSPAEQQQMVDDRDVDRVLSAFFAGTMSAEDMWREMKSLADTRGPNIVSRAQLRLLDSLSLQTSAGDFKRSSDALLALEMLRGSRTRSTVEMLLGSLVSLRQRYAEIRDQAYQQLRAQVQQQLQAASEQARRQGLLMDTESSIEASIKGMPEWRDFMSRHDASAQQSFDDYVVRIKGALTA